MTDTTKRDVLTTNGLTEETATAIKGVRELLKSYLDVDPIKISRRTLYNALGEFSVLMMERDRLSLRIMELEKEREDDRFETGIMSAITGRQEDETLTESVSRVCNDLSRLRKQAAALVEAATTMAALRGQYQESYWDEDERNRFDDLTKALAPFAKTEAGEPAKSREAFGAKRCGCGKLIYHAGERPKPEHICRDCNQELCEACCDKRKAADTSPPPPPADAGTGGVAKENYSCGCPKCGRMHYAVGLCETCSRPDPTPPLSETRVQSDEQLLAMFADHAPIEQLIPSTVKECAELVGVSVADYKPRPHYLRVEAVVRMEYAREMLAALKSESKADELRAKGGAA